MITFILNNKTITTPENSGMTLLDFVRYQQRLTGTKIGCREGDCGACTVLVGTLENDRINYQSITSCISPLGNAHGKHIVTVEGTNLKDKLTTAQEAMKANYATQCGFCTPGFVVALTGFALSNSEYNYNNALDAISGNICRCTGYKAIEKAAHQVVEKLEHQKQNSINWLVENDFIPAYFESIPKRLKDIEIADLNQPKGKYVSGGTDLYVQQADHLADNDVHLIAEKDYLKGIKIENGICTIGTNATVSDLWNHTELNTFFPNLKKHLKLVSSEQIRNMASLGGNLVNASPIGDMTIFFLALNSDITIINEKHKERTIALKNFFQDYKTYDLKDGELLKAISFKLPTVHSFFNFEKVCKRTHLDIASVNSALSINVENGTITEANVSIGGVAAIPKYLHDTSAFLVGKTLNSETILEANEILQNEISPISDVRGTSDYKRLLGRQLFFAHFTALFPKQFTLNDFVQHA
ncbi:FAD binding domain-containing protein [Winogradskyella echinorum]|uniref:FAD binding domain-containing protein n=1 Tax=Winogradskyella echinorum TaxID=538189 RepID=A0ABR6XXT5_9FLAO|nr:FAD binding domain-containing protein [Winogradskyella echinorum]MBC3845276.1 FAD binding domain-containing protein [Winogradskyella echinorum]MBC5749624.1 FAD binding domain-containing protein [Winogradskyella echinorum]